MLKRLEELKADKHKRADEHSQEIESLLKLDGVDRIPLTPELVFRAKRRLISKRMPIQKDKPHHLLESDALIVESLVEARQSWDTNAKMFFCSENRDDFGLDVGGEIILDPRIQDQLPKAVFRTTLAGLLAAIDEQVVPPEPGKQAVSLLRRGY